MLINKVGWAELSFQIIAKKCGMSPANIVYHFKSKEELLLALLNYITENNWNIVSSGLKPDYDSYDKLLNHFQKNLDWARKHPEQAEVVLQIYAQASRSKNFSQIFSSMIEKAQDRISDHLLAGKKEGIFHYTMDHQVLAKYLHSILIGGFVKVMGGRTSKKFAHPYEEWSIVLKNLVVYK